MNALVSMGDGRHGARKDDGRRQHEHWREQGQAVE